MAEFWSAFVGVIAGVMTATLNEFAREYIRSRRERKLDQKRSELLEQMLRSDRHEWRNLSTLANVIGAGEEETRRLLILLGARASETGNDTWALVTEKPLP